MMARYNVAAQSALRKVWQIAGCPLLFFVLFCFEGKSYINLRHINNRSHDWRKSYITYEIYGHAV
jgi:hypothetical protein